MMKPIAIKTLKDNYTWCLLDQDKKQAIVVDCGEAAPVLAFLQERDLDLIGIVITHFHFDHIDGVSDLLAAYPEACLYATKNEFAAQDFEPLQDNGQIQLHEHCFNTRLFQTHCIDHVLFFNDDFIFSGDLLFNGSCGRVFQNAFTHLAPDDVLQNMFDCLAFIKQLNPKALVCSGHEYSAQNLIFALSLLPDDLSLSEALKAIAKNTQQNLPSAQFELDTQFKNNLFFRCHEPNVSAAISYKLSQDIQGDFNVFKALRNLKDIS